MLPHFGEEVADLHAALAAGPELPRRLQQVPGGGELHPRLLPGDGLPVVLLEHRLGVEGIDLARPAVHEQEDDALGLRCEVRLAARSGRRRVRAPRPLALRRAGMSARASSPKLFAADGGACRDATVGRSGMARTSSACGTQSTYTNSLLAKQDLAPRGPRLARGPRRPSPARAPRRSAARSSATRFLRGRRPGEGHAGTPRFARRRRSRRRQRVGERLGLLRDERVVHQVERLRGTTVDARLPLQTCGSTKSNAWKKSNTLLRITGR